MEILNHGQIARMRFPADWVEAAVASDPMLIRSLRVFQPRRSPEARFCLYYRGHPVVPASARNFVMALAGRARELTPEELWQVQEIVRRAFHSDWFAVRSARIETWNGRKALVVEGRWNETGAEMFSLFLDADGSGFWVQEIYYTAPADAYRRHLPAAMQVFASLEWQAPRLRLAAAAGAAESALPELIPAEARRPRPRPAGERWCSRNLTGELLLPGRTAVPGERLPITRVWREQGRPFLALSPPGKTPAVAYSVRFILATEAGTHLLLQLPDSWWDPDVEEPPQALARLAGPRTLEALTPDAVASLLAPLWSARASRLAWDADRRAASFAAEVREHLGPLPEAASPESAAHDPGLTNELWLGTRRIGPGQPLAIVARWQELGYLTVRLAAPGQSGDREFSLRWFFPHQHDQYAIILYPPDQTADDDRPPRIVVKVRDAATVVTLADEELAAATPDCSRAMARAPRCDPEAVFAALGPFPEWQQRPR